jgi:hypothetical protein
LFKYKLYLEDGSEVGEAAYAQLVNPGGPSTVLFR